MKKFIGWRGCGKTRAICKQAYELAKQKKDCFDYYSL